MGDQEIDGAVAVAVAEPAQAAAEAALVADVSGRNGASMRTSSVGRSRRTSGIGAPPVRPKMTKAAPRAPFGGADGRWALSAPTRMSLRPSWLKSPAARTVSPNVTSDEPGSRPIAT